MHPAQFHGEISLKSYLTTKHWMFYLKEPGMRQDLTHLATRNKNLSAPPVQFYVSQCGFSAYYLFVGWDALAKARRDKREVI